MNGNDILEYIEQRGDELIRNYYETDEEMSCFDQYSNDPEFARYAEQAYAETYFARGE